jgi:hypothetical protein
MLGLDGFRVPEVAETSDQPVITEETTAKDGEVSTVWYSRGRRIIGDRWTSGDLACFGPPASLRC